MASDALRHATIIAGGIGSRAHGMTGDRIPKALLAVAGVPILVRQLRILARENIQAVTVLAGHLGGQLEIALAEEVRNLPLTIEILVEREPLGTAGCLTTLKQVPDQTLIVYGDMLFDVDLSRLAAFDARLGAKATIVAHPNDHPESSDLLIARDGLVRAILPAKEPRSGDFRNLVPAGLYLATRDFLAGLTPGRKADMIHDVLPAQIGQGMRIGAYNTPEYLRDVGTPARHAKAETDIASGRVSRASLRLPRPAIFFDIDGTLSDEPGGHGVLSPDQIRLLPGAAEAVRLASDAGYRTVAVTNRPQLAKGMLDLDGLDHIFGRLESLLAREKAWLDRIYYCPHHPERGHAGEVAALKVDCRCRKPGPGMLEDATEDLNIDLRASAMIGDSLRDIGAAQAMGIPGYGVRSGYGCRDAGTCPGAVPQPDGMFDTVLDAVNFIASRAKSDSST
jgi:histidinol-phosphate phosphatase family protein